LVSVEEVPVSAAALIAIDLDSSPIRPGYVRPTLDRELKGIAAREAAAVDVVLQAL
jgi:hypothetical protein